MFTDRTAFNAAAQPKLLRRGSVSSTVPKPSVRRSVSPTRASSAHVNDGSYLIGLGLAPNQPNALVMIANLTGTTVVPEPATLLLFGAGAAALLARRRRNLN